MSIPCALVILALTPVQQDPDSAVLEAFRLLESDIPEKRAEACQKLKRIGTRALGPLQDFSERSAPPARETARRLIREITVDGVVTDRLKKSIPRAEDRLLNGGDHAWTEVLLETEARPPGELTGRDLVALAGTAIRSAATRDEKIQVCDVLGSRELDGDRAAWVQAMPAMVALLREEDQAVQMAARGLLVQIRATEAVPDLLALTASSVDAEIRIQALEVLTAIGDRTLLKDLQGLAQDEDERVVLVAIRGLARVGGPEAVAPVAAFLANPRGAYRSAAIRALGSLNAREYRKAIAERLKDSDDRCRGDAAAALGRFRAAEYIGDLHGLLRDETASVRAAAIQSLQQLGAVAEWRAILERGDDENGLVRRRVLEALLAFGEPDSSKGFESRLEDDEPEVRALAAEGVGRFEARSSLPRLKAMLRADTDSRVRLSAASALSRLGDREGAPAVLANAERSSGTLFSLNGVRCKDGWARLGASKVPLPPGLSSTEVVAFLEKNCSVSLDATAVAPVPDSATWSRVGTSAPAGAAPRSVRDVLEQWIRSPEYEIIVDPDRIRILPHSKALSFWNDWTKSTESKPTKEER